MGGGVYCCRVAHKEVAKFPQSVWNVYKEELVIDGPSFFLAMVYFFLRCCIFYYFLFILSFISLVVYRQNVISLLVCRCSHGVSVWMCVLAKLFSIPSEVTSCMVCMGECMYVHTRTYFLFCFHCTVDTLKINRQKI